MKSRFLVLFTALAALALAGCNHSSDPTISVADDDAEMSEAIAKARESLPKFWQVFDHPDHGETDFSLKLKITDANGTEHFWTSDVKHADGKIQATIDNDPEFVKSVKRGDRITVKEEDISDWMFTIDGKMKGNYTLRILLKQMSAKEAAQYRSMLAPDPEP